MYNPIKINKNTIAFRLNLYVASAIVILGLVIFFLSYLVTSDILLSTVKDNARNIAEKNVNKVDAVISRAAKIPLNLASVIESTDLDEDELITLLKKIVENNNEIFGSAIAYEPYMFDKRYYYYSPYIYKDKGTVKSTYLNSDSYDYFYQDWYQVPKILNKPVWSQPYYDKGGGNILMTTYSVPFYKNINGKKTFRGIITIDIGLEWLEELISTIKILKTGFAFVVSQSGEFITHPNKQYVLNESLFSLAEEYNLPQVRDIGRRMIKKESGFFELNDITTRAESIMYFTSFKSNDWSIAVFFPKKELYAGLYNLGWMIISISIFGIILIVFTIAAVLKKLTRPLTTLSLAAGEIGSGKFDLQLPEFDTNDEVGTLHKSFKKMQVELANYIENLKITTAEKEQMHSELRIAHQIQMGLIPKIFPAFPNREDIDLHAFLVPAREVGGDLYDFFFIDDDKLVLTIGDVSGKGVPASLFMAVTRTLIRSRMTKGAKLTEVVDHINADLKDDNDTKLFVTLILCIVNLKTREIEFTNAGHNYPYIISEDGKVLPLKDKHGMALGVFKIKPYSSSKYLLKPGEKLVLYTDGINEAMDKNDNEYDYERFEKTLCKLKGMNAKDSTALILKDIRNFTDGAEQSDDMTFMVLELK